MAYYATSAQTYAYLWSKYRPAILRLMVDSVNGPQQYKFLDHEFKSVNAKEKGGYAFEVHVTKGKADNPLKMSKVAKDLLQILQQSGKAIELTGIHTYEFKMDKQFNFQVTQLDAVNSGDVNEDTTEEAISVEEPVEEVTPEVQEGTPEVQEEKKEKE